MGFPVSMFPVLFAIPRTAGWIAQWEEMLTDPEQKIARPRQIYTGPDQARLRQPGEAAVSTGSSEPARVIWYTVRSRSSSVCWRLPQARSRRRRNSTATARSKTSAAARRDRPARRRDAGRAGGARLHHASSSQAAGIAVEEQPFEATTPLGRVKMVNLRATLPRGRRATTARLVIGGHYDTKLFKEFTFVGANDGGSSAAFLIELARALKTRANRMPIELLFLDGEEAVGEWQGTDHTYGSRYYVDAARKDGTLATFARSSWST